MKPSKFCEQCGAPLQTGVNFCEICGNKVALSELGLIANSEEPVGGLSNKASALAEPSGSTQIGPGVITVGVLSIVILGVWLLMQYLSATTTLSRPDGVAHAWLEYQAAEAVYKPAFEHYTALVTTGGNGDAQDALVEYRRAYAAKNAAYQRWIAAKDAASGSDKNAKQSP